MANKIYLIAENIRSANNTGSLLRTADCLGLTKVFFCGYTPYPATPNDERLPHQATKANTAIAKTALGAEKTQSWEYRADTVKLIKELKEKKVVIAALEQHPGATKLYDYKQEGDIALIVGNEIGGVSKTVLAAADDILEIPMYGRKESLNVSAAAAMAFYHLKYFS